MLSAIIVACGLMIVSKCKKLRLRRTTSPSIGSYELPKSDDKISFPATRIPEEWTRISLDRPRRVENVEVKGRRESLRNSFGTIGAAV